MQRLLVRIPDDLAVRLKREVPARERSALLRHLLEQALTQKADADDTLYQVALAVEQDEALATEVAAWDCTVMDGFRRNPS